MYSQKQQKYTNWSIGSKINLKNVKTMSDPNPTMSLYYTDTKVSY